jgi:hypothetical protein
VTRTANLQALLRGFTRCGPVMAPPVRQAIAAYATRRTWPRYMASPSYLAHDSSHWWGTVGGCVVILKRKWVMGYPVLHAVLPPMSLPGDDRSLMSEMEATDKLLSLGIGVKYSEEDVVDYIPDFGCFLGKPVAQKGNVEYIYDLRGVAAAEGKQYARLRAAINAYRRTAEIDSLESWGGLLPSGQYVRASIVEITDAWAIGRPKQWAGAMRQACAAIAGDATCSLFREHGTATAYSLSEKVTDSWYIGALALRSYSPDIDFARCGDMVFWQDAHSVVAYARAAQWPVTTTLYYNFGSAVNSKGLTAHKEELGPCKRLQIYDVKPAQPVTAEEWKAAVPGLAAQPVLL